VGRCLGIDFPDFEILILSDSPLDKRFTDPRIRVFPTGPLSPPRKRDMALVYARGEIIAFLDDDAYPQKDWLKEAADIFSDAQVAAVGGPAVTPDEDSPRQKASGAVYSSFLVSGPHTCRYVPLKRKQIDDYPTCNFFVRKSILEELGGFKTNFWPGEDTKLCLDIIQRCRKKIIYDPAVLVYHHRRPLFLPHLRQVASYALHRGYFVKRFPATSFKASYFVPSLFLSGLIFGAALSLFIPLFKAIYFTVLSFYLILAFIAGITSGMRLAHLVFAGIILTHLTYGLYFIKGLFSKKMPEEG